MSLFSGFEALYTQQDTQVTTSTRSTYEQGQRALLDTQRLTMREEDIAAATERSLRLLGGLVEIGDSLRIPELTEAYTDKLRDVRHLADVQGYCAPFSWMAHARVLGEGPGQHSQDGLRVIHGWNLYWSDAAQNDTHRYNRLPSIAILLFQETQEDESLPPRLAVPLHSLATPKPAREEYILPTWAPKLDDLLAQDSSLSIRYKQLRGANITPEELSELDIPRYMVELDLLLADGVLSSCGGANYERKTFLRNVPELIARRAKWDRGKLEAQSNLEDLATYKRHIERELVAAFGKTRIDPEQLLVYTDDVPGVIWESSFSLRAIREVFQPPNERKKLSLKKSVQGGLVGAQSWVVEPTLSQPSPEQHLIAEGMLAHHLPYLEIIVASDEPPLLFP